MNYPRYRFVCRPTGATARVATQACLRAPLHVCSAIEAKKEAVRIIKDLYHGGHGTWKVWIMKRQSVGKRFLVPFGIRDGKVVKQNEA